MFNVHLLHNGEYWVSEQLILILGYRRRNLEANHYSAIVSIRHMNEGYAAANDHPFWSRLLTGCNPRK